jgi:eukaryotic-like serine/threonine-protein kinase
MTLAPGTRLGPYEILTPLGAGGMGEVYRATDTKLGREVAIKVLPETFAADPERMARFEREAKVLASLNHPNIGAIYGLEHSSQTRALVMELVDGPTLADRIDQGPVPVEDALHIAKQIAEALEYAHESGIVHRDLKPANIKLRPDERVKVLDFGLAKAVQGEPSDAALSNSPTMTAMATQAGIILGTAAYMSPEQAKGKFVDRRADIWAFGVVLFEMLTGQRLFVGETVSETLASVIKDTPDLNRLPSGTPIQVQTLLQRCLTRDPKERLRDIGEARIALDEAIRHPNKPSLVQATPSRRFPDIATLIAVLLGAGGMATGYFLHRSTPAPSFRASVDLPEGVQLDLQNASVVLSPDGRTVVLVASPPGQPAQLWTRRLDQLTVTALPGTEDASSPFWSPDGRFIGFFSNRKLKKVPLSGGAVQSICDAVDGRGGTWNKAGMIVFSPESRGVLLSVPAAGGVPVAVTTLAKAGMTHRLPQFLPDGKRVLFFSGEGDSTTVNGIYSLDVASKKTALVLETKSGGIYVDPGYLIFVRDGILLAQPIDGGSLRASGDPAPIAPGVQFNEYRYTGNYSITSQGLLLYLAGSPLVERQLTWFDLDGRELDRIGKPAPFLHLSISPTGTRVMFEMREEKQTVWSMDLVRGARTRFTFGGTLGRAVWSKDGKEIATTDGNESIYVKSAAGDSKERLLYSHDRWKVRPTDWSPDGSLLALNMLAQSSDIWVLPVKNGGPPRSYVQTQADEENGEFSPDGTWLLYSSNESGRYEVYLISFPEPTSKWQISTEGSRWGLWTPDGHRIIYETLDRHLMAVDVTMQGANVQIGPPQMLFGGAQVPAGPNDLSPDRKRILVAVPVGEMHTSLTLVTDWREGLRRK